MLAFMLTGGVTCNTRWEEVEDETGNPRMPSFEDYAYYNLLFQGRSALFDAVRDFDTGNLADPEDDLKLWNGEVHNEWVFAPPTAPASVAELRRLKRRYFFEHQHDKEQQLQRMLPGATAKFHEIVTRNLDQGMDQRAATEHLIECINMLYAPRQKQSDKADYATSTLVEQPQICSGRGSWLCRDALFAV